MDNVYGNAEIVFSHLEKRQAADLFKGHQDIYANAAEQESREKQNCPVEHTGSSPLSAAENSGAPCRCSLALLAVLCLALLGGLTALGILYVQKSNRSNALEDKNRELSISLSSVEQRLAGTERKLEELQVRHRNASETLSAYRDIKRNLEELQVKHTDLLKTISHYNAMDGCACLTGWRLHQGKCYFFSTDKMNWSQSQEYCTSKGAQLVIINNQQEQNFVSSRINETHWIGLSDRNTEGQWVWVDGTPLDRSGTQYWWAKEPDNWMGAGDPSGEDCAALGDHNGNPDRWFDASCGKIKKFVCETLPRI
ncbi:asialoglycoprotein receptor 1-like isoform X1 [Anguilla anguilla]|uniref:asialoglycoprotein receptor 1-like isoform X1 n=1 Tax=Anguilla anguilla TaxID=7936 RepID=UPI0015A8D800|nr:asialoglycoprotein receptor 1-like isoform X1 [Anguilla anguilla]